MRVYFYMSPAPGKCSVAEILEPAFRTFDRVEDAMRSVGMRHSGTLSAKNDHISNHGHRPEKKPARPTKL
jgi:hypothetical protein